MQGGVDGLLLRIRRGRSWARGGGDVDIEVGEQVLALPPLADSGAHLNGLPTGLEIHPVESRLGGVGVEGDHQTLVGAGAVGLAPPRFGVVEVAAGIDGQLHRHFQRPVLQGCGTGLQVAHEGPFLACHGGGDQVGGSADL